MKIYSEDAEKAPRLERKTQAKETNQKVLAKEGRLKRFLDRTKQYKQNMTFQNNERKFNQQIEKEWAKTYEQPDAKEAKMFGAKCLNGKIIKKPNE